MKSVNSIACQALGIVTVIVGAVNIDAAPGLRLPTVWTAEVSATNSHPEYPRPGLVRSEWLSLNGKWEYSITAATGPVKGSRSGSILVPFPVESQLSGVEDEFTPMKRIEYRRRFQVPKSWDDRHILIHFDAVNWEARVELNGKLLGVHRGGYERFSYDVTDVLTNGVEQELTVTVTNPIEKGKQPRGKQTSQPDGIWYRSASGIWQTVWLEPVATTYVAAIKAIPDLDHGVLRLHLDGAGPTNSIVANIELFADNKPVAHTTGVLNRDLQIIIPQARLWSPESPFLYDLRVSLIRDGKTIDEITSYFGMRKISVSDGKNGPPRLQLNNQDYFQLGVLDQGYWPDGIYTAPTDEALRSEIALIKKLGFNLSRKHVKVEPERWYYWCDRLGLLVWQDIPSTGIFVLPSAKDPEWQKSDADAFRKEVEGIVRQNWNHPSIVVWTAFNEGWGQHDTANVVKFIKELDPERLVISASGWNDRGLGDVLSLHRYPGPAVPQKWDARAVVSGECGGLGFPIKDHVRNSKAAWSYSKYGTKEELRANYELLINRISSARKAGLSGAVITQLTDVESEVNGLVTYDRAVIKFDAERINRNVSGGAAVDVRQASPK